MAGVAMAAAIKTKPRRNSRAPAALGGGAVYRDAVAAQGFGL